MHKAFSYSLVLLWTFYLLLASVSVFLRGFLLSRDVLSNRSSCGLTNLEDFTALPQQICTQRKTRVLLFIIDALMHDFTIYNDKKENILSYENKMPVFHELLSHKPNHTILYRFLADPPTTTMQRLKGLTTGSLPTFIDASANFASEEISEDNFVDQLIAHNRSVVFMGDDTWNSLYPGRFLRSYPFPSFNVWDLDTVDQGVLKNLAPELRKRDWDLLIAHFLGVDHCGHRFGPSHPEMVRKLTEMDVAIRRAVATMDDDTMLVVVGDHGMTPTGNHGGDSWAELSAAIFVHSPSRPLLASRLPPLEQVHQVDLVPTLSALLGSPVPFSSLGALIVEALPLEDSSPVTQLDNNLLQVHTYLAAHSAHSDQLPADAVASLTREFHALRLHSTPSDLTGMVMQSRQHLRRVKHTCEEVWVQFDLVTMGVGLLFTVCSLLITLYAVASKSKVYELIEHHLLAPAAGMSTLVAAVSYLVTGHFVIPSCLVSLAPCVALLVCQFKTFISDIRVTYDWLTLLTFGINLASILGMGSNSYVVEEGTVISFLICTLTLAIFFKKLKILHKSLKNVKRSLKWEDFYALIFVTVFCGVVRLFPVFWQCREEQDWCENSRTPQNSTSNEGLFRTASLLPLVLAAVPVCAFLTWFRRQGNLSGVSVGVMVARVAPVAALLLTFLHLTLEGLSTRALHRLLAWDVQHLARAALLCLTAQLACLLGRPLLVFLLPTGPHALPRDQGDHLTSIFRRLKREISQGPEVPTVFGLASVFSAAVGSASLAVLQLLLLLQGGPALVLPAVAALALLALHSLQHPAGLRVPWSMVSAWGLLSVAGFYATGRQPTFASIHWQAAFVGTDGEFSSNLLPGLMVSASTLGAQAWLAMSVVLLVPISQRTADNGEMALFERSHLAARAVFNLALQYATFHALRVLGSMLTASVLRRHLMVWKIFAPKLIFEVLGLTASLAGLFLGWLLFWRVAVAVERFMAGLERK